MIRKTGQWRSQGGSAILEASLRNNNFFLIEQKGEYTTSTIVIY
jgi:hypothetical protein